MHQLLVASWFIATATAFLRQHLQVAQTTAMHVCMKKIRIVSVAMEYAVSDLAGMLMQDPNTGVAMFETPQIIEYLEKTYAV